MGVFERWADEFSKAGDHGAAKMYEDFEKGVGTYLKVVRFPEPPNPDGFIVLYLRSTGFFLLSGYWSGYEQSVVAGRWSKANDVVRLEGLGETSTDALPNRSGRFEREFRVDVQNHTPILIAENELTGWSLLGWAGNYTYMGQTTVINPDSRWLPGSFEEVDAWIEGIVSG
jgi:hypothetical protein